MSEQDFSRIFKEAAPGEPSFEGWGDKVRKGHRRRQTTIAVAAVTGVVALGVPLALQVGALGKDQQVVASPPPVTVVPSDPATQAADADPVPVPAQSPSPGESASPTESPSPTETPSPTDSPSPSESASTTEPIGTTSLIPEACQKVAGSASVIGDGGVAGGATRVWLCQAANDDPVGRYGPAEPLVDPAAIQSLVDQYNNSEVTKVPDECPAAVLEAYTVIFEYEDGATTALYGNSGGCNTVGGQNEDRLGGDTFLEVAKTVWTGQRAVREISNDSQPGNLCMQSNSMLWGDISAATRGLTCGVKPDAMDPSYPNAIPIPEDLVQMIAAQSVTATNAKGVDIGTPVITLVLQNDQGDPMTLRKDPVSGDYFFGEGDGQMRWTPSEDTATRLDELQKDFRQVAFEDPEALNPCIDPGIEPAPGQITDAVGATVCVLEGDGWPSPKFLKIDEVATLTEDFAAKAQPVQLEDTNVGLSTFLLMMDDQGRSTRLEVRDGGALRWHGSDGTLLEAKPSAEVAALLAQYGVTLS